MDQAEGIRNVIKLQNQQMTPKARVITITSGKGGVGNSNQYGCFLSGHSRIAEEGKALHISAGTVVFVNQPAVGIICAVPVKYISAVNHPFIGF